MWSIILLCWSTMLCGVCAFKGDGRYGERCRLKRDCGRTESYLRRIRMECDNGVCACQQGYEYYVMYERDTIPRCVSDFDLSSSAQEAVNRSLRKYSMEHCKKGCDDASHIKNMHCNAEKKCVCNEGFFRVGKDECKKGEYVEPTEECVMKEDLLTLCNHKNHSFCRSKRCLCFGSHYLNFTTKECVDKKVFSQMFNTSEYKAQPLHYCVDSEDCMDGLDCSKLVFKCQCPSGCHYEEDKVRCNCGAVTLGTPDGVIPTGICLSLLSLLFWCCCIRRTVKKKKKKRDGEVLYVPPALDAPVEEEANDFSEPPPKDYGGFDDPPPPYESLAPFDSKTFPNPCQDDRTGSTLPYPIKENLSKDSQEEGTLPYPVSPPLPNFPQSDFNQFPTNPYMPTPGSSDKFPSQAHVHPEESTLNTPYPLTPNHQNLSSTTSGSQPVLNNSDPPYPLDSQFQKTSNDSGINSTPSAPPQIDSSSRSFDPYNTQFGQATNDAAASTALQKDPISEPFSFQPIQGTYFSLPKAPDSEGNDTTTTSLGFSSAKT